MRELAAQLVGIFQQHVHIHASRGRGEEEAIRRAVAAQEWLALRYLLREMSDDPFPDDDPAFSYPKGLIQWGQGERDEALTLLDNATRHYAAQEQHAYAALCQIESADICQERGEFLSALHALERARNFLDHSQQPEPRIYARFCLLESVLAVDTGQMKEGLPPAQKAQSIFHQSGDTNSEFLSLMQLANLHVDQAAFEAGRTYLQAAQRCYTSGPVLARYEVRLGNSTVFLHWYTGDLEKGLADTIRLQHLCKRRNQANQQVYAYVLEANLCRALGQFEKSERAYTDAAKLAADLELPPLQRLIGVNRSWLYLLQGRIDEARRLLEEAAHLADSATQMQVQVSGAVLNSLTGHSRAAERGLRTAREFYYQAGDHLSVCAIDFHLVHLHLRTDQRAAARQRLDATLAWMEQTGVDYFPHWWHPATVYSVLNFGEEALPAHASLIHRMLRVRIGEEPQSLARRASELAILQNGQVERLLEAVESPALRSVLRELLGSGLLRASRFPDLCRALGNGEKADARAFLLCAIFGLYLRGDARRAIAAQVNESEGVVRHAIRRIFERLAADLLEVDSTNARKIGLGQRARAAGYVGGAG